MSATPGKAGSLRAPTEIRATASCHFCATEFPSTHLRFIAESRFDIDDPVLGAGAHVRFRPLRFDADGRAIDPGDQRCSRVACPACHHELPRFVIERRSIPVMIAAHDHATETAIADRACDALRRLGPMLGVHLESAPAELTPVPGEVRELWVDGKPRQVPDPSLLLFRVERGKRRVLSVHCGTALSSGPSAMPELAAGIDAHLGRCAALVMAIGPGRDGAAAATLVHGTMRRVRLLRAANPGATRDLPTVIAFHGGRAWPEASRLVAAAGPSSDAAGARSSMSRTCLLMHQALVSWVHREMPDLGAAIRSEAPESMLVAIPSEAEHAPILSASVLLAAACQSIRGDLPEFAEAWARAAAEAASHG